MVARTILTKRQDAAIERIEEDAKKRGGDSPAVAEAAERLRTVRGPDEEHIRVFRIEAIADLMEAVSEATAKPEAKATAKPQTKRRASKQSKGAGE